MTSIHDVYILYIPVLELDAIFHAIGNDVISDLTWGVEAIAVNGPQAQDFCTMVESAPEHRILVTGTELLEYVQAFLQVDEGIFAGYHNDSDAAIFLRFGWARTRFTSPACELAMVAVDGCGFDVYLRSRVYADRLTAHFKAARWEDPANYLV
jgi:hypothetical protein